MTLPVLFLVLMEMLLVFPIEYDISSEFVIYDLYYVEICSLHSYFAESFLKS